MHQQRAQRDVKELRSFLAPLFAAAQCAAEIDRTVADFRAEAKTAKTAKAGMQNTYGGSTPPACP